MANLMTGSYTYMDLVKKYNNFLVPALKIKVLGKDVIQANHMVIDNVSLSISLNQASVIKFNILNAYDIKKRSFDSNIKKIFVLGTVFSVELGYGSNTTMVFKGYVETVEYMLQEFPELSITGTDVRRLMMNTVQQNFPYVVQNYFNVFTMVMEKYKKICTSLVIDKTQDKLTRIVQNTSDYDFITKDVCVKSNREFFVIADKAYFLEKMKNSTPIITLGIGNGLISFNRKIKYLQEEIKLIGVDEGKKQNIEASIQVKAYRGQKSVLAKAPTTVEVSANINNAKDVNVKLKALKNERLKKAQGGSGSCIGLPELVPGRYVKIAKFDKDADDTYFINKIEHSFSLGDGFSTQFEIAGYKEKK